MSDQSEIMQLREQVEALQRQVSSTNPSNTDKKPGTSGFDKQLQKQETERGGALNDRAMFDALKTAQPAWQKDSLGVRGNPVQFQRQQILNDTPPSTVGRRNMTDAEVAQVTQDAINSALTAPPGGTGGPSPNPSPLIPPNTTPDPSLPTPPADDPGTGPIPLATHKCFGVPSNVFGDFTEDRVFVYNNRRNNTLLYNFSSEDFFPDNVGVIDTTTGIPLIKAPDDLSYANDPGPYHANPPKIITVFIETVDGKPYGGHGV